MFINAFMILVDKATDYSYPSRIWKDVGERGNCEPPEGGHIL